MTRALPLLLSLALFSGCVAEVEPMNSGNGLVVVTDPTVLAAIVAALGKSDSQLGGRYSGSGGWSMHGDLVTGSRDKQVTLQAVFPRSAGYTVQFDVKLPATPVGDTGIPAGAPAIYANPEALITWSVEGNFVTRRVTVGDSVSVSGTAQGVRVVVYDASAPGLLTFLGQGEVGYEVSIQVTPDTRPSTSQPPTLILPDPRPGFGQGSPLISVTAGTSVIIPLPTDAGFISVFGSCIKNNAGVKTNPANGDGTITIGWADNTPTVKLDYTIFDASDIDTWRPIPPGSNAIILQNNLASPGPDLDFAITLGIDG